MYLSDYNFAITMTVPAHFLGNGVTEFLVRFSAFQEIKLFCIQTTILHLFLLYILVACYQ
jgi:hypothetical protein